MRNVTSVERGPVNKALLREETLAELFRSTAQARPGATAIADDDGSLTYQEVDRLTDRLAAALAARGAEAGRFVGLWMPRGREVLLAQIAISKTGAAWLPFDADAPLERVVTCLNDLGAIGIVLPAAWAARAEGALACFPYPDLMHVSDAPAPVSKARADDPAYVIYTSGSTGRPKGIVITHRNICHFLRAAALEYGLGADDVMLSASSIAFDLSLEEIWLPYLVGAQLRVCSAEVLADPASLRDFIVTHQVTALDVVPTLLGLLEGPLPSVRLIIVGGEACPEAIVRRYATPTCRLINSYGPSEATVVATATRLLPGQPITIGRPLANMSVYVVDENLQLVERGREGELLLGGPGIAAGYVGRPDLTAEKFIPNHLAAGEGDAVLYRTGDAVVMTAAGELLFRGRIDDQVKIRGFRVELGEIETRLGRQPGIAQAAVVVNAERGFDQLVGFVVLEPDGSLQISAWKHALAAQLPPYMLPSVIEVIDVLPRLAASGKIDRKALAKRPLADSGAPESDDVPQSATEAKLAALAKPLFPGQPIALDADFFLDLGGHSLLAAQFVSAARRDPQLAGLALNQLYESRSLRALAARIDAEIAAPTSAEKPRDWVRTSSLRRFWCGLAQLAVMPLLLTMQAAPWLSIFITYALISDDDSTVAIDLGLVFLAYAAVNLALAMLVLAAKWLVLGRTKPGRYPLWGTYFFRLWLTQRMLSLVHLKWMQNSPILPVYLRALGAKVGKDVLISDFDVGAIDLLSIGNDCSVGSKTVFANARIEGGWMYVGPISLGHGTALGSSCVLEGDVSVGDGSELADLTSLKSGSRVPAGELWDGAPGVKVGTTHQMTPPAVPHQSPIGRALRAFVYLFLLLTLPAISILPVVPAFRLMEWLDSLLNPMIRVYYLWYMPFLALSAGAGLIAFTLLLIVACRWIVLPRVAEGRYPVTGNFYIRRWAVGLLTEAALDTLSSLFATLYMRAWYRMMGCKIGKGTEISTSFAGRYELISLGAGNFIADDVVFGDDHLRHGWLTLERTETEDQVFVGNEAVVPQGSRIGTGALIGVKSKPPQGADVGSGETWFGSPPIQLPTRQRFAHDVRRTYTPPFRLKLARALFEGFNISLPTALFITLVTIVMEVLAPVFEVQNWGKILWICIVASTIISLIQLCVGAGYKWLLMGRYQPTVRPMWSWWALRTEAVAVMYWGMAGKALLDMLRGTPMLPIALRLFGVRTGKGIYMDSTDITEFDCVTIGNFAEINNHACLQTHLYEDRLMKVGRIAVGEAVVVGAGSTVLYDTMLGDESALGPLTLVMKGEVVPPKARFGGSPARPMQGC